MRRVALVLAAAAGALAVATPPERIGRGLYHAGMPRLADLFLEGDVWRGATLYAQGRFMEAAASFNGARFSGADYDRGTALAKAGDLTEAIRALEQALIQDPNDEDARYNLAIVESLKAKRERAQRDAFGSANANASKQKRGGEAPSSSDDDVNSIGDGAAGDRDSGHEASSPGRAQVSRMGRAQQSRIDERQSEARGAISSAEGGGRTGGEGAKVAKPFEELVKLPKKSYSQQTVQASPQWLETIADDPGRFVRLKLAAERAGRAERGLAAPTVTDPW